MFITSDRILEVFLVCLIKNTNQKLRSEMQIKFQDFLEKLLASKVILLTVINK